ncbi:MAG TPA: hypothetical protein VF683_04095 [Chthoniobacterales bacterium]
MKKLITVVGALFVLLLAGNLWLMRDLQQRGRVNPPAPAPETIESSGRILGLAIGDPIDSAREKLDPLRVPAVYTPDLKETSGRRILWRLRETEYDWIMAWAKEGKITRIRAVYRADRRKPFREIGNLASAASATADAVKWNLSRPGGPRYRLIAQGAEQQAQTVYMFSLELPGEQQERSVDAEPAEED